MFNGINMPFDARMLFNVLRLKPGKTIEDAELAMGEMCNVVKNTYRDSTGSLNFGDIVRAQDGDFGLFSWYWLPHLPMVFLFFISALA